MLRVPLRGYRGAPTSSLARFERQFGNTLDNGNHTLPYPLFRSLTHYLKLKGHFTTLSYQNALNLAKQMPLAFIRHEHNRRVLSKRRIPMEEVAWVGEQVLKRLAEFDQELRNLPREKFFEILPRLHQIPWNSEYTEEIIEKVVSQIYDPTMKKDMAFPKLDGHTTARLYCTLHQHGILSKNAQTHDRMYDYLVRKLNGVPFYVAFRVAWSVAEHFENEGKPIPWDTVSSFVKRGMIRSEFLKHKDLYKLATLLSRHEKWSEFSDFKQKLVAKLDFLLKYKRISAERGKDFITNLLWSFRNLSQDKHFNVEHFKQLAELAQKKVHDYSLKDATLILEAANSLADVDPVFKELQRKFKGHVKALLTKETKTNSEESLNK
jgi:hypothetical protein